MKVIIIFLIVLASILQTKAQEKNVFWLNKEYKIVGIIFPESYKPRMKMPDVVIRFTPNIANIKIAEQYLLTNDPVVGYEGLDGYYSPHLLKTILKTYKRQYLGWINAKKDSIILVHLLNFKQKRAQKEFAGWENEFVIAFDGFYEKNIISFIVNLSQKKVSFF